jgi:hypothetical protein
MSVNTKYRLLAALLFFGAISCTQNKELDEITETQLAPGGGTARSFDGLLSVEFPAGAVERSSKIIIETRRDISVERSLSAAYVMRVDGAELKMPAEIRLKLARGDNAVLAIYENGLAERLSNTQYDAASQTVFAHSSRPATYLALSEESMDPDAGIDAGEPQGFPDAQPEQELEDGGIDAGEEGFADAELTDSQDAWEPMPPQNSDASTSGNGDGSISACSFDGGLNPGGPDLVVGCYDLGPTPWHASSQQFISFDVSNVGDQSTGVASTARIYLDANMVFSPNSVLLYTAPVGVLGAGATQTISSTISIPALPPGTIYVMILVDAEDGVAEATETNNLTVSGPVTVAP